VTDESWLLDEAAHTGAEHLDEAFIAGFDRKQGYPDAAADIAAFEAHGLDGTSVVVDLGAGTGQFAIPAARRFGRVIAVDLSPAMVTALRAKASAGAGVGASRLTVECAGFLSFDHGAPVDGVFTRHALHQIPDFWKAIALRRIADMLRPGGVLRLRDLVYDFGPGEAEAVFADWFAAAAADPTQGYTAADYAEHIRTEHSTFRWLLEPMLAAAGFEITDVGYQGRLYGAYTCVKNLPLAAGGGAAQQVGALGLIGGEGGGTLEFGPGSRWLVETGEQVAADRGQQVVTAQGGVLGQGIHDGQGGGGAVGHRDGHRAVELDDR
jgi:SAM-dependent methyltransferase